MAVYITGDIHGDPHRLGTDTFFEQKEFSVDKNENIVIILGDFGLIWQENESKEERWWLKWLQDKPFTTVFIDGNHDNFPRIYKYPVKEWNGGKVHVIRPNVLHLMRGEVFNIEGKKFFAFGGASSHDISDGIIDGNDKNWRDQARRLDQQGKYMYRVKGLSWWSEELPTDEEMSNGIANLEKNNHYVDFIITHSPPASITAMLGSGLYKQDILTRYLEEVRIATKYQKHFMGHMHLDKAINDKDILMYEQIIRIV